MQRRRVGYLQKQDIPSSATQISYGTYGNVLYLPIFFKDNATRPTNGVYDCVRLTLQTGTSGGKILSINDTQCPWSDTNTINSNGNVYLYIIVYGTQHLAFMTCAIQWGGTGSSTHSSINICPCRLSVGNTSNLGKVTTSTYVPTNIDDCYVKIKFSDNIGLQSSSTNIIDYLPPLYIDTE